MSTPPNWYADPTGRFQMRYWDGDKWTEHVSTNGVQGTDSPLASPTPFNTEQNAQQRGVTDKIDGLANFGDHSRPDQIQEQLHGDGRRGAQVGQAAFEGGGSIFDEPILVVNQKAKLMELKQEYSVFNQGGTKIAAVNQVGQSGARKALRLLTNLDQFLTTHLDITDAGGRVLMRLTRPAKVFKSTVVVSSGEGQELGRIVQDNVFGKIHFTLQSGGHTYGAIKAENWRAWNFRIEDHNGTEVARITKTWEGLARTMFTTADNYVVQIHTRLEEPLRSLVVASALGVDTALKQDDRGLG
jgi:uncharacterized protein YxjI